MRWYCPAVLRQVTRSHKILLVLDGVPEVATAVTRQLEYYCGDKGTMLFSMPSLYGNKRVNYASDTQCGEYAHSIKTLGLLLHASGVIHGNHKFVDLLSLP